MRDYRSSQILPVWIPQTFTLTALTTVQQTFQLASDYEFELHQIFGSSSIDTDTDFMPNNFSLTILGTTGRLSWTNNAAIDQRIICAPSNGGNPLYRPITFPPNSLIQMQVTDLTNGANVVHITLFGYYLFGAVA